MKKHTKKDLWIFLFSTIIFLMFFGFAFSSSRYRSTSFHLIGIILLTISLLSLFSFSLILFILWFSNPLRKYELMKVQCPHCPKVLSVPDHYRGKKIRCAYCHKILTASPIETPPEIISLNKQPVVPIDKIITIPVYKKQSFKSLKSFFADIQRPVKISFFSTLGVISALLFCFYIYSYFFNKSSSDSDFIYMKNQLSQKGLFLSDFYGEMRVFQGRTLKCYKFKYDVNYDLPYLDLYVDEIGDVAGIMAIWKKSKSTVDSNSLLIKDAVQEFGKIMCNIRTEHTFLDLVGYPFIYSENKFSASLVDPDKQILSCTKNNWNIYIVKSDLSTDNYIYAAIAINW